MTGREEKPEARGSDGRRGLTLIEVLIAVSLLSLLSVGMLWAMRVGLGAMERANFRLMENRRIAGAQRVLESQLAGFMPVMALCAPDPQTRLRMAFFHGEPEAMRFVSTYSLNEAWRGTPQILEFTVIPRPDGGGVRLVVNEIPYTGPESAGALCLGALPDPLLGIAVPRFRPIQAGPRSFILADSLQFCRFSFLEPAPPPVLERWQPRWVLPRWPLGVRIEMAPMEREGARLRPVTVTAPVRVNRSPEIQYVDY